MPGAKKRTPITTQINRVLKIAFGVCGPDPLIFVEMAVPALVKSFYTLVSPTSKEIIKQLTGKSLVKNLKQDIIEEGREAKQKGTSNLRKYVFGAAEAVDQHIWYLFCADMVTETLFAATSQIYKVSGCQDPTPGHYMSATRPFGGILNRKQWQPCFAWVEQAPQPGNIVAPQVIIPPGRGGMVSCHFNPMPIVGPIFPYAMRIYNQTTAQVISQTDILHSEHVNEMGGIVFESTIPRQSVAQVILVQASGGIAGDVGEIGAIDGSLYWQLT